MYAVKGNKVNELKEAPDLLNWSVFGCFEFQRPECRLCLGILFAFFIDVRGRSCLLLRQNACILCVRVLYVYTAFI